VPVVVVLREVEADARGGVRRAGARGRQPVQLEARDLDDEHVEAARIAHRVEHGNADVAAGRDAPTVLLQHRGRQLGRGGLAVRARDEHPVGGRRDLVAHAPGELDVSPQWQVALAGPHYVGVVGEEARRDDDEVERERVERRRHRIGSGQLDQLDADHRQDAGAVLIRSVRCDMHAAAELGESVGDREARHAEPEHEHPQPRPVVVPARQVIRSGHHYWLTHSR